MSTPNNPQEQVLRPAYAPRRGAPNLFENISNQGTGFMPCGSLPYSTPNRQYLPQPQSVPDDMGIIIAGCF